MTPIPAPQAQSFKPWISPISRMSAGTIPSVKTVKSVVPDIGGCAAHSL